VKRFPQELLSYHEIRVGQIHRRPTRPKIRVGLVLYVLHGSGAYVENVSLDPQIDFFEKPYFGPYGVLTPVIFTRTRYSPTFAIAHPKLGCDPRKILRANN